MNAQYTKGPWATIKASEPMTLGQSTPLYVAGGIKLATIKWNPAIYRADVMDANARLIAAAPAMYDALKIALRIIEAEKEACGIYKEHTEKIRAALAAAEGK